MGWPKGRELYGHGAIVVVRERESRLHGEGLQVAKLHRIKRIREMRLAQKYMEAVSI